MFEKIPPFVAALLSGQALTLGMTTLLLPLASFLRPAPSRPR
jgi:hypothetical protein